MQAEIISIIHKFFPLDTIKSITLECKENLDIIWVITTTPCKHSSSNCVIKYSINQCEIIKGCYSPDRVSGTHVINIKKKINDPDIYVRLQSLALSLIKSNFVEEVLPVKLDRKRTFPEECAQVTKNFAEGWQYISSDDLSKNSLQVLDGSNFLRGVGRARDYDPARQPTIDWDLSISRIVKDTADEEIVIERMVIEREIRKKKKTTQ